MADSPVSLVIKTSDPLAANLISVPLEEGELVDLIYQFKSAARMRAKEAAQYKGESREMLTLQAAHWQSRVEALRACLPKDRQVIL